MIKPRSRASNSSRRPPKLSDRKSNFLPPLILPTSITPAQRKTKQFNIEALKSPKHRIKSEVQNARNLRQVFKNLQEASSNNKRPDEQKMDRATKRKLLAMLKEEINKNQVRISEKALERERIRRSLERATMLIGDLWTERFRKKLINLYKHYKKRIVPGGLSHALLKYNKDTYLNSKAGTDSPSSPSRVKGNNSKKKRKGKRGGQVDSMGINSPGTFITQEDGDGEEEEDEDSGVGVDQSSGLGSPEQFKRKDRKESAYNITTVVGAQVEGGADNAEGMTSLERLGASFAKNEAVKSKPKESRKKQKIFGMGSMTSFNLEEAAQLLDFLGQNSTLEEFKSKYHNRSLSQKLSAEMSSQRRQESLGSDFLDKMIQDSKNPKMKPNVSKFSYSMAQRSTRLTTGGTATFFGEMNSGREPKNHKFTQSEIRDLGRDRFEETMRMVSARRPTDWRKAFRREQFKRRYKTESKKVQHILYSCRAFHKDEAPKHLKKKHDHLKSHYYNSKEERSRPKIRNSKNRRKSSFKPKLTTGSVNKSKAGIYKLRRALSIDSPAKIRKMKGIVNGEVDSEDLRNKRRIVRLFKEIERDHDLEGHEGEVLDSGRGQLTARRKAKIRRRDLAQLTPVLKNALKFKRRNMKLYGK